MNNESRMPSLAIIAIIAVAASIFSTASLNARPGVEITGRDWGSRWVVDTICTKNQEKGYPAQLILTNTGTSPARIRSVELIGTDADAGYFRLDSSMRSSTIMIGDSVRPGDDLYQSVIFKPAAERSYVAKIRVITEAGDTTENILTGVGIESHGSITDIRFDTMHFAASWPITPEARMAGSVTSTPTRRLTITDIIIDSVDGGDFIVDAADLMRLPVILQPGQRMTFNVIFHPTKAGLHRARIAFVGDHSFCDDSTGVIEAYLTGSSGVDRVEDAAAFTLEAASAIDDNVAIRYSLAAPADARIEIFNAIGERVTTLLDDRAEEGAHTITWSAAGLPRGVYYCRILSGGRQRAISILLHR